MELGNSPEAGSPEASSDFGFAFNEVNFSDRVLRIEILPESPGSKPNPDDNLSDWARNRKRRRDDRLTNVIGIVPKCCVFFAFVIVLSVMQLITFETEV